MNLPYNAICLNSADWRHANTTPRTVQTLDAQIVALREAILEARAGGDYLRAAELTGRRIAMLSARLGAAEYT